jgi:MFS family permease
MRVDNSDKEESETPVPYRKVAILGLVLTSNNCAIWIIYTMIPFMVQHFFPHLSLKELGFRAGIIGSAFSVGSLFGNFLWGIVADKYGRKPALVGGLFGTVIAALLFGFSSSFWMCVFARFLWGFLNGNIGVSKTYMAEITDDSNNARSMALYGVIGGFGRTIGPVIGGFLINPAKTFPATFKGTIFESYPFALPVTLVAAQCLITVILAVHFLDETLKGTPCYKDDTRQIGEAAYGPLNTSEHSADEAQAGRAPGPPSPSSDSDETSSVARSKMKRIAEENPLTIGSTVNDGSTFDTEKAPKKRKSVGFANIVMVKTIGSTSMGYGPLKKVMADDVPVEEVKAGGGSPLHSMPVVYGDDGRVESGLSETKVSSSEEGDEEFGALEDHPELTPIKGSFGVSGKARESPSVVQDHESSIDSDGSAKADDGSDAAYPLIELRKERHDARAPKNMLVFSNGAEFYAASSGRETGAASNGPRKAASRTGGGVSGYFAMVSYLLSRRQVLLSTAMYGLNGFVTIMAAEIFPLWVVTRKADGGFGFNSQMIGLCTMISGPISMMGQLVLYPSLVQKLGLIKTYKLSCQVYAVTALLLPCVSLTNSLQSPLFTTALVVLGLSVLSTTQMWVLISVFSFINNSCYSYQRATVNSIGQTFAAMGRLCGPYLGSVLFAWSETNELAWPLDYAFTWYLVAILSMWSGSLVGQFPRSIQRRKREPKRLRYAQPGIGGGLTEHELVEEWEKEEREYEMQSLASGGGIDLEGAEDSSAELALSSGSRAGDAPSVPVPSRTLPGSVTVST